MIIQRLLEEIGMVNIFCYSLFVVWAGFSIKWIIQIKKSDTPNAVNPYLYDAIPTVFTTLGVFGTFVGIFLGLQKFDVNKITESIPTLLEGLKTAFFTSIVGLVLSFIFGRILQSVLNQAEKTSVSAANNELSALNEIIRLLTNSRRESVNNINSLNGSLILLKESLVGNIPGSISTQLIGLRNQLKESLVGNIPGSVSAQLIELRNQLSESQDYQAEQNQLLENIITLGCDEETSFVEKIVDTMNKNNELISKKFDEFVDLLAKNNTEALVDVMKTAVEQFNAQMSALVEKLVKENFEELNNSVQRMNQWQQENKEMITQLTAQFTKVSEDFTISSTAIKEITTNTTKLTNENSHLSNLIKELQKVMIDDTKYQEIVGKLTVAIDTLKENTDAFEETTNKLNNWVKNQMNFTDSVAKLLTRLEEIEKIKDINDIFWNNIKKQLNEGVSVIATASKQLSSDLENINTEFYERLNDTLQNLDTLIQRIITNYK